MPIKMEFRKQIFYTIESGAPALLVHVDMRQLWHNGFKQQALLTKLALNINFLSIFPFPVISLLSFAVTTACVASSGNTQANKHVIEESAFTEFSYGEKGYQYASADGNNFLWFGVRLQTRYSNSSIQEDLLPNDPIKSDSDFEVNRGRLKFGGHLFIPEFTVYSEYDFTSNTLLDLRASYEFTDWLNIRIGQWKSQFNRERSDSSGAQQFAERSIVTPWFTIDRQKAFLASGRFGEGKQYDSSYWFGWLSGAGRGGDLSDANGMWLGRYQWNFSGRVLAFSQSDINKRDKAAGSAAVSLINGESQYTSFSSTGGGQLPGFTDGESDQYNIEQALFETAWQSHGFSWQQELHWKTIDDRVSKLKRKLSGGYAQTGMFFSEVWKQWPEPLELAIRLAHVDMDRSISGDYERENTLVANWFFNGHRNKLTADLSYVKRKMAPETDTNIRYRIQWDVSF